MKEFLPVVDMKRLGITEWTGWHSTSVLDSYFGGITLGKQLSSQALHGSFQSL